MALSLAVFSYGLSVVFTAVAPAIPLMLSGVIGFAVTLLAKDSYQRRHQAVRALK